MSETIITPLEEMPPEGTPGTFGPAGREIIHRHTRVVRITHWINALCLGLLLLSGLQIFNAHSALYWGKYGADADKPLLEMSALNTPSGKLAGVTRIGGLSLHTTGFLGASGGEVRGFPGWLTLPAGRNLAVARRWHFFLAWTLVVNGLIYLLAGVLNGHFRRDLAPTADQLKPRNIWQDIVDHARLKHPIGEAAKRYNSLQKFAYLAVIVIVLPTMVLTGLTLSPGMNAAWPGLLILFGGRQSARTLHFITANLIVLFVLVHVIEVFLAGVVNEIGSMITGRYAIRTEGSH